MTDDDILPESEAAEFLTQRIGNVSLRTLRRWNWKGTGPPRIKVNGRVAYRKSALLDWLMGHEYRPPRNNVANGNRK